MKLLITAKECNDYQYHYFYDLDRQRFIENVMERLTSDEQVLEGSLPSDLAAPILLLAFQKALRELDYETAVSILTVSVTVHRTISRYYKTGWLNLFPIIRLAANMVDHLLVHNYEPTDHIYGIECKTEAILVQPWHIDDKMKIREYYYFQGTSSQLKLFAAGPTLMDVAFINGIFAAGVCIPQKFAFPYILFRVSDYLDNNQFNEGFITKEWSCLARILTTMFGPYFKLFTYIESPDHGEVLVEIPTAIT